MPEFGPGGGATSIFCVAALAIMDTVGSAPALAAITGACASGWVEREGCPPGWYNGLAGSMDRPCSHMRAHSALALPVSLKASVAMPSKDFASRRLA